MKNKLLAILLGLTILASPATAAEQWAVSEPAGSQNVSDIDTLQATNNAAQQRLLLNYKRGLGVNYSSANAVSVLTGEVSIANAAGSLIKMRSTTGATSVGWSDIDTGSEELSKTYYLYATGDTDISGMVFKISLSSSAPSGATYYRAIGQFYNNSSGNIEKVVSYRNDNGTDYQDVIKGWINFNASTATINDSYNVTSITDNGTGDFTISWDTDFANAYYAVVGTCTEGEVRIYDSSSLTASSSRMYMLFTRQSGDGTVDPAIVSVMAIGDR